MRISLIAAITPSGVMGKNNQLPWRMPADLHYFKKVTLSKTVIMGRKTYASIGRPLGGRRNIVISRDTHFTSPECEVFHSLPEMLAHFKSEEDVFVIGGGEIFAQMLPLAEFLYITFIEADIVGDTYFPAWDKNNWQEISREYHAADSENSYNYSFVVFKRIQSYGKSSF